MLKSSDTVRTLLAAKELIGTPDKWCQGVMETRSKDGTRRMCMGMAINDGVYMYRPLGSSARAAWTVVEGITRRISGWSLVQFNDHATHSEVMRVLDEAIATAE